MGKGNLPLRWREPLRDTVNGIRKPEIRRLARRGGVKRISGEVYKETRDMLKLFLDDIVRDAIRYTEHARRRTVSTLDVVAAMRRRGRPIYGFDDAEWKHQPRQRRQRAVADEPEQIQERPQPCTVGQTVEKYTLTKKKAGPRFDALKHMEWRRNADNKKVPRTEVKALSQHLHEIVDESLSSDDVFKKDNPHYMQVIIEGMLIEEELSVWLARNDDTRQVDGVLVFQESAEFNDDDEFEPPIHRFTSPGLGTTQRVGEIHLVSSRDGAAVGRKSCARRLWEELKTENHPKPWYMAAAITAEEADADGPGTMSTAHRLQLFARWGFRRIRKIGQQEDDPESIPMLYGNLDNSVRLN